MTYATLPIAASTAIMGTAILAAPAAAQSVDAGTLIENTATASYTTGGAPISVDSNTVTILVDELLNVVIASQDAGPVAIESGQAVLTYEITNTGNGPEAFNLTANPVVAGNEFTATIDEIAYDTNNNGVYDEGVDPVLPAGTATPEILADDSLTVFVVVSAPDAADGETAQVNLLAEAATGIGDAGTVFAGQGVNGGNAVVGNTRADADTNGSLIATVSTLDLLKEATIVDPFGGNEAVPGSVVTFRITASVSGSAGLADVIVTDAIPAGTTYLADSLALDGSALTDAADADAGQASSGSVEVAIGSAAANTDYLVTFDVTID